MSEQTVSMTDGLGTEELMALETLLKDRSFQAGEALFVEDESPPGLVLLVAGTVKLTKRDVHGVTQTLTMLKAPAVLGELELVSNVPSNATVTASSEVDVRILPTLAFENLVEEGSVVATKILRNVARALAQKLVSTNELCVDMMLWK